ncbi:FapA family protein [Orrella sp. JC864]|uniref:DUF342 domain-containing protein n=1 Tax=Orrella sp. JC864 TaxID=3120298 RepID=UPI0030096705
MNKENGLALALDSATGLIRASYTAVQGEQGEQPPLPGLDEVLAACAEQGWPAEAIDETAVRDFLSACRGGQAAEGMRIGEIRDGRFDLEISADAMSAYLSIEPPQGGAPVGIEQVRQRLTELEIYYGVDEQALHEAVAARQCTAVLVASGDPPQPGAATRFESLLPSLRQRQRAGEAESGRVDYRDLGNLLVVTAGTPLMRRIPAQQGREGRNLHGDPLPPAAVPDLPFRPGLSGVEISEDDPCVLLAARAGVPRELGQGVCVDPVLEVESVDLATGNVDFDGTLKVRGDIKAGMSVKVAGDIVVNGTIEAAHIVAGGNITVRGGVIGGGETLVLDTGPEQGANTRAAYLRCEGNLEARFLDNAVVSAGGAVRVQGEIRQSDIAAGDSIVAGGEGNEQGAILGGRCRALRKISAATVGSLSNLPTAIQVGVNPHAAARRAEIARERAAVREERAKLEKLLAFFKANPEKGANGVADRVRVTYAATEGRLQELDARDEALTAEISQMRSAVIQATRRFCGGVQLQVGSRSLGLIENHPGGQARLEEDAVVIR